ncbi:MAG: murJ [Clostridiales bacterium]|jgi:putative peptidoglycan lipid II flippase|nr:murJ [Clostridiales bacterium]
MHMLKAESVRKATFIVMVSLLLSRVLGLIRNIIVSYIFGMNNVTDAFRIAFAIPDMMFDLLISGALSAGFMPVFGTHISSGKEEDGWQSANSFITFSLLFASIFIILGIIFTKLLIPLVGVGMMKERDSFNLVVNLTRIMFPAVMFTVMAGLLKGILNTYKRFSISSLGPVMYNVGIILGAIALGGTFGIYGMAIGVLVGGMLNFLIQVPEFLRLGKGKFKLKLDINNQGFRKMFKLMGPTVLGLGILRINVMINLNIASVLGQGSASALDIAQRIMMLPLGIFGASVSTTIYPSLNSHASAKNYDGYRKTLLSGIKMLMFITIPCAVGLVVLNEPIIRFLFKSGKFTEENVRYSAIALAYYTPGIVAQACVPTLIRGFYSLHDTKTPLKIGAFVTFLNITLNILFLKFSNFAIAGIALSSSITSTLEMILLIKALNKRITHIGIRELSVTFIKSLFASVIMGILVFITFTRIEMLLGMTSKANQLIAVLTSISAGIFIYASSSYIFKIQEFNYCFKLVKEKLFFKHS